MSAPITEKSGKGSTQTKTLIVEWQVAEDDHEWHLAKTTTLAVPAPVHHWSRHWWVATAIALLFLLAAGGRLWHQAHAGLSQIEGELQAAVEAGQWQEDRASRMDAKPTGVIESIAQGEPLPGIAHVQLLDLGEDWAIVQVTTMPAWPSGSAQQGELAYRQTRLYRRGASGWYAAAPSAALWGAQRTIETTYFVFHYYALDTEAVAEAAIKLDAFYPDLATSYPFDPDSDGKHQIWVSPEYSLEGAINRSSDGALEIASPAIYLAPTYLSEGDILAQAVLLELLEVLANQSLERQPPLGLYHAETRVYALLRSLGLWQLWSTELPLATLHKPTIQWIYGDVQGKRVPPAFDAKLCSLHQLWRAVPYAIQLPLFCGDPQQLRRYEVGRYLPPVPPRSLAEIHLFTLATPDEPYLGLPEAEQIGLATLLDYAATTYGRQSLSTLITNAASLSSWETLIPATFGVPPSDFETGWQAHLRNHYQVSASAGR
jgi:hypothetical protein